MSTYYLIPLSSLPPRPSCAVWFATWSVAQPIVTWSAEPPDVKADEVSAWVVGVVAGDDCHTAGAIALGGGGKDLPPPPLVLSPQSADLAGFRQAFAEWLTHRGDQ